MTIEKFEIKVSTTGSSGSASGSGHAAMPIGELVAVHLNFDATNAPSTMDTTLTAPGNPASLTILTLTDVNTDGWYFPKVQDHNNVGAAVTGSYSKPLIHNGLDIAVAQADAGTDTVVATLYVRV